MGLLPRRLMPATLLAMATVMVTAMATLPLDTTVATTAMDTTRGLLILSLLMAMATATAMPTPPVLTMVATTAMATTRGLLMLRLLMAMATATATLPMLPIPTVTAPTTDTITKLLNYC